MTRVLLGFGSAGSSRSGRRIASAVGVGQNARERDRRATFPEPARLTEPDRDEVLSEAAGGFCVWCTDGRSFRNLALHWERGHGFDVAEIRERLVLPKQYRFASQEYRDLKSRQAIEAGSADRLRGLSTKGTPHVLSTYGKRANAEKYKLVDPEKRLAALRKADPAKRIAATRARWAAMSPDEREVESRHMADIGRKGAARLQEYLRLHPEAREKGLANRKQRHGY